MTKPTYVLPNLFDMPLEGFEVRDVQNFTELWWCNTHERLATSINTDGTHRCDPTLAGIMLPCCCVDVTGLVEVEIE